jgi:hypothetical protein
VILFVDLHQHPKDPGLEVLRRNEFLRRWPAKCFVYDERDQPFFTLPGLYVGATRRLVSRHPAVSSPYLYVPALADVAPAEPTLLFSFRGARTSPVRDAILGLSADRGRVIDTSGIDFFDRTAEAQQRRVAAAVAYAELIGQSKFVLCPRGNGPSSFRLYETLRAGRVPVIISDEWVEPPGIPWERCAIRVAESEVGGIPDLLASLESRWPAFAAEVVTAHAQRFAPSRLWDYAIDQVEALAGSAEASRKDWRWRLIAQRAANRVTRLNPSVSRRDSTSR